MADKLIVAKTEKHLATEAERASMAEIKAKIKSLTSKANKDVVLADIYEQNKLIIEVQYEIVELLKSGQ